MRETAGGRPVGLADPTTTRGDLLARGASALGRLAIGAAGKVLGSDGTDPLWIDGKYNCLLANTSDQTIATATSTALTYDTETYDNGGMHSTSVNTSRITAPVAGLYFVYGMVYWAANATGFRETAINKNGAGAGMFNDVIFASATSFGQPAFGVVRLAVNDYIEFVVYQTSGGNLAARNSVIGVFAAALLVAQ